MPRGLNRSGNYSNGTVVDTTLLEFGTPINLAAKNFGNPMPVHFGTDIVTSPDPTDFGNVITDTLNIPVPTPPAGTYSTGGQGLQIYFVISPVSGAGADYVLYTTDHSVPDSTSIHTFQANQIASGIFAGPVILGASVTIKYLPVLAGSNVILHIATYSVS